jgi:hypothetical protein
MSEPKAVKFQHRIATGHSTLAAPFTVESDNPLYKEGDELSSKTVKQQFRHHKPVPTALVVDDALVLAVAPSADGLAPRVSLVYVNGNSINGADWHNALSLAPDVPHVDHDGAEVGERFYWDPTEDYADLIAALEASRQQNEALRDQLAAALRSRPQPEPDVTTLLDAAPAAPSPATESAPTTDASSAD